MIAAAAAALVRDNSSEKSSAPQWLIDRMEALKKLPPPTLEEVRAQFEASAKFRRDNAGCHKHKEYDMVLPPECDCYHCWCAYTDKHQTKESFGLFHAAMDKYGGLRD
jgi:hypothetical protein